MRKMDKFIIWPAYFDANKTRAQGRRLAVGQAVISPRIQEIQDAALKLGLKPELIAGKAYAKTPWSKQGTILVEKQGSKEQTIKRIARQLLNFRTAQPKRE